MDAREKNTKKKRVGSAKSGKKMQEDMQFLQRLEKLDG